MATNKFFPDGPIGTTQPKVTVAPAVPSVAPPPTEAMTALPPPPSLNMASGGMRSGNFTMERSGDPAYDNSPYNAYANTGSASQGGIAPLQPPSSQTPVLPPPTQETGLSAFDAQFPPMSSGYSLPSAPRYTPGSLEDYLRGNMPSVLTDEQIRAEAARLRALQIDPRKAELERQRGQLKETYQLADSQAGEGRDEALRNIDKALKQGTDRAQARAIRGNLVSSNIPETTDFRPLEQEAIAKKGTIEEGIANRRAQIQLAFQQGDASALDELSRLAEIGGLIEAQAISDLTARERGFSEQARGNRAQEFFGNEGLRQNASNMNFRNELDAAMAGETVRQNRFSEGMQQKMFEMNKWATENGYNLDLKRLEAEISSGDLDRAMKQWQLTQAQDPNSIENRTAEANLKAILARASSTGASSSADNGLTAYQQTQRSDSLAQRAATIKDSLRQGAISLTDAQGEIDYVKAEYDAINGAGAFERRFGSFSGTSQTPSTTPTVPTFSSTPEKASYERETTIRNYESAISQDSTQLSKLQAERNRISQLYASASAAPNNDSSGSFGMIGAGPSEKDIYGMDLERLDAQIASIARRIKDNQTRLQALGAYSSNDAGANRPLP